MDDAPADQVSRSLSALAAELGEVADVGRETLEHGIIMVDVTPSKPGRAAHVIDGER